MAENKGGAGGTVGMAEVAKAPADGYTLALSAISPLTLSPHLMKLPYDPFKDIVAVAPMMYSPVYVLGTTAFSGKSWDDLIAQAKAKPGSIRIATSGVGSVGHIMVEQIQAQTGVELVHVPYKGVSQVVTDAAGAHFEVMLGNPFPTINALIEQGKQLVQTHIRTPDIQAILQSTDNIALFQSREEFADLLRKESANNAAIIEKAGIRM